MSNEIKVGLAVLAAALVTYFGIQFLSDRPLFGGGYDIVVVFESAQGIAQGSAVLLNGVRVGSVRRVALSDDARQVFVTLRLNPGTRIPRGAVFGTSGLSALGDVAVSIRPPTGADAGRPLAAGDTVIARPAVDLFDLLAGESTSLTARADTALTSAVSVFSSLDQLLINSGDDLQAVLAQLRFLTTAATQTLLTERERVGQTLGALQRAAASAERFSQDLGVLSQDLSTDLRATTGTFRRFSEENSDSLAVTIAGLNTTLRSLDRSLTQLDRLAASLDTTLAAANRTDGTLGLLLQDPSLYNNANAAAASLQQILADFQRDPARYLREFRPVRVF